MAPQRHSEIGRPADIVDTFVALTRQTHEVSLRFENAEIRYPVSVVAVDRVHGTCLLDIAGLADVAGALATTRAFILHARAAGEELCSSAMRSVAVAGRADRLALRCPLPERLLRLRQRGPFRAALAAGVAVDVVLRAADGASWRGTLCDLSLGGCLLSLPLDPGQRPRVDRVGYRLSVCFPNGERFTAGGRIRRLQLAKDAGWAYAGVVFDIGLPEEERALWFYVNEIEREVARRTSPPSGMRSLAASRLFPAADDGPIGA